MFIFTPLIKRTLQALDRYDPYGFMRVSAMQALTVILVLFMINFAFSPFAMTTALQIPVFGIIATSIEKSFSNRIRNVAVFCGLCIAYAFLLAIVQEYRFLVVISVGVFIFSLFMFSKLKFPFMLGMVTLVQVVGYTLLKIPEGASFNILLNYGISYVLASAIGLVTMALFPRVYFFRVWLRIVQATLHEFEQRFMLTAAGTVPLGKLTFVHFVQMYDYTPRLSYREHGLFARKVALLLVAIYAFTVVTYTKIEPIDIGKIFELAGACKKIRAAMDNWQPIADFDFSSENLNPQLIQVYNNLEQLRRYWNRACLSH